MKITVEFNTFERSKYHFHNQTNCSLFPHKEVKHEDDWKFRKSELCLLIVQQSINGAIIKWRPSLDSTHSKGQNTTSIIRLIVVCFHTKRLNMRMIGNSENRKLASFEYNNR